MKRTLAVAALLSLSLVAASALAQSATTVEPRVPGVGAPAPQPADSAPAASRTHDDADARACLEFLTNEGVIRCAEKYLHAPHRAAH